MEKDIFEPVKKYIKYDEVTIPKGIAFDKPLWAEAYENAKTFEPFRQMSEKKWEYRAFKGEPKKLAKLGGAKLFEGVDVPLQEIHPHKFIKLINQLSMGRAPMPVIFKDKDNEFWILSPDGLDMITIMYHFKQDEEIDVWLVDESINSIDFEDDDEILGKEVYVPNYDYGNITDDDRILIREICEQLEQNGNKSDSEYLKQQFQLKQAWQYDLKNSPFVKFCQNNDIRISKQGYMTTFQNNETREYPIISICEDIRKFEKLVSDIVNLKVTDIKSKD